MEVRFYDGKRKVYTVIADTISGAIQLIAATGVDWTKYRIY